MPEDVVLNLSVGAPVPPVPDMHDGLVHTWGAIVSDPTVEWTARYRNPGFSGPAWRAVYLRGPVKEKED